MLKRGDEHEERAGVNPVESRLSPEQQPDLDAGRQDQDRHRQQHDSATQREADHADDMSGRGVAPDGGPRIGQRRHASRGRPVACAARYWRWLVTFPLRPSLARRPMCGR